MIRILHFADLHLDSPFVGLDAAESEKRRGAQRELFSSILSLATQNQVQLVLIPGDLFDSDYTGPDTVRFVMEEFGKLPCPVVIAPGNHDPFVPGGTYAARWPENVRRFDSEQLSFIDFGSLGVRVYGYAFTGARYEKDPLSELPELDEDKINLLCAHTALDMPLSTYAPITKNKLSDSGFVYAALGHVHKAPEPEICGRTLVAYCGCPEGRSFDELDYGHVLLTTIEGGMAHTGKIRVARHRYMIETVDVSGTESDSEIAGRIRGLIEEKNYGDDAALRVILGGVISPDFAPSPAAIAASITGLAKVDVRDNTTPSPDFESLMDDLTIKGEFYRLILEKLKTASAEEKKVLTLALRMGLCALDGKPILMEGGTNA